MLYGKTFIPPLSMNHFGPKSAARPVAPIGYCNEILGGIPHVKRGGC